MGELANALQADREGFERQGGQFRYSDPTEMVRDLVVLKRAIPQVTILASDNPLERLYCYVGYWHWRLGEVLDSRSFDALEVVAELSLPTLAVAQWEDGTSGSRVAGFRDIFRSAEGRQRLIQTVNQLAAQPEPEPEPEDEPRIRTRWERMLDDDEPL